PPDVMASLAFDDSLKAWGIRDRELSDNRARVAIESAAAATLARSLAGCDSQRGCASREECFAMAPVESIGLLRGLTGEDSWIWRERWLSRAPKTVLSTLALSDDPRAWEMRERTAARCKEAIDSMV